MFFLLRRFNHFSASVHTYAVNVPLLVRLVTSSPGLPNISLAGGVPSYDLALTLLVPEGFFGEKLGDNYPIFDG